MAFCINCGQELAEGAKFCASCGNAVGASQNGAKEQRKTVYDGELHKCPNCGEQLGSFVTSCPACGYELRGTKVTSVVNELAQKLERTESVEQKIDLIRNFYIPNTKEDICEFFILATSNMNTGGYDVEAWYTKLEQAYQKARLLFGTNLDFSYFQELYDKASKQKKKLKIGLFISKWWMCFLGSIVTIIGLYLEIMGGFRGAESGDPDSPYYMLSFFALFIIGGGVSLFITGIKHGISHTK